MRLTSVTKSEAKENNTMAVTRKQIDSNAPSTSRTLDNSSTVAERSSANRKHHEELVSHTLTAAEYGGHGHAIGRQGKAGHTMVPSDHAAQGKDAFIPQGILSVPQNRQNTSSDGSGSANANDPSTSDYATADPGDK
jgi:hypothetical protein